VHPWARIKSSMVPLYPIRLPDNALCHLWVLDPAVTRFFFGALSSILRRGPGCMIEHFRTFFQKKNFANTKEAAWEYWRHHTEHRSAESARINNFLLVPL